MLSLGQIVYAYNCTIRWRQKLYSAPYGSTLVVVSPSKSSLLWMTCLFLIPGIMPCGKESSAQLYCPGLRQLQICTWQTLNLMNWLSWRYEIWYILILTLIRMNVKRPPRNWHIWYVTWYTLGTTVTVHLQASNILHDWRTTIGTVTAAFVEARWTRLSAG